MKELYHSMTRSTPSYHQEAVRIGRARRDPQIGESTAGYYDHNMNVKAWTGKHERALTRCYRQVRTSCAGHCRSS